MLAHIRQGDGTCWASQSDITRLVGVSRESACKWMGKLEESGWLEDDGLANVGQIRWLRKWRARLGGQDEVGRYAPFHFLVYVNPTHSEMP